MLNFTHIMYKYFDTDLSVKDTYKPEKILKDLWKGKMK